MGINQFNIRVYGFLIEDRKVLVTDEFRLGIFMTKFPGGGLEYGEGPADCLQREIIEEMNGQDIEILSHFYTTDYFQQGIFHKNSQVICIYYLARFIYPLKFKVSYKAFDFPEMKNGAQSFRFINLNELSKIITFPTDKVVANLLNK